MPKKIEHKIERSLRKSHPTWSAERRKHVTFARMNKLGLLHRHKRHKK